MTLGKRHSVRHPALHRTAAVVLAVAVTLTAGVNADAAAHPAAPESASTALPQVIETPDPEEAPRVAQERNVTSVVPARLVETRVGPNETTIDGQFEGQGALPGGSTLELTVAGRGGTPADATAVMLNVTAIGPNAPGFLTVFPCGEPRPTASNVNYSTGQVVPNAVLAKVGDAGKVCIFTLAATHLIADVNGYISATSGTTPVVPARLAETRSGPNEVTIDGQFEGAGPLTAGATLELEVAGRGGVPATATAVMLNVTAVGPAAPGFLTVFPCGEDRPNASNVNYSAGQVVPNAVLAKVGDGGKVCVYSLASTHLIVDVNGYVAASETGTQSVQPARLLETRTGPNERTIDGEFEGIGAVAADSTVELDVAGRGGVPDTGVGAVMLNVTAITPDGAGFLTVFPCGQDRPNASNVNYSAGQVVPNAVLAQIGDGGKVCIYTLAATHLVIDVNGWFDLPPNQPESDVMVLDDEPFEIVTISGGSDPGTPIDSELMDDPEIVEITTNNADGFIEGDKVVLSKPSGEPYYGEITDIDGTTVTAEEVALAEVLPTMDVSLEADMNGEVTTIVGGDAISNFQVDRSLTEASQPETEFECTAGAGVDFTATATADAGRFVLDVSFNIFDGLTAARIGFNPIIEGSVTASANGVAECTIYRELYTKQLPTIKFWVGPVPVWITHEVEVGIGASVKAEASASITLSASASAFAGIVYRDGQWDRETSINLDASQEVTTDVAITATISVPIITYKARAYGIAGFDASLAGNLQLTYRPFAKKRLSLTTFVDLGISLVVELDLVVTYLHWQFDFPKVTLWGPVELWSHYASATNCDIATVPEEECIALVDLWEQADGSNWSSASNWVSNNDPCGWEGVTCSGGNVTSLDLSNKRVVGPVPPSIGGLSSLQTLDLSSDLGFPQNLIESIPSGIADLDALQTLHLDDTGLTSVPTAIGGMANLRTLDLTRNELTSLPNTIGDLGQLRSLTLDDNPLLSLPRQVGDLANLETLRLEHTDLTNLPPELSNLSNLVNLFVGHNAISSVPDLSGMPNLFAVFVGDSNITSLPTGLENLTGLFVLNADRTAISTLPVGLGESPDLFQLQLTDVAIDGDITPAMQAIMSTAPAVEIWLTSSGCPEITDPAVLAWFESQVQTADWNANC